MLSEFRDGNGTRGINQREGDFVLPLTEDMMATCQTRNLTISLLVALLPMNVALAGGRGGGAQGAVGYGLSGSSGYGAAVGGGAPAGAVGGGPPAGLIGGGIAPTNTNHTRSSGGGLGPGVG